ncbi:hypothetical protein ALC62_12710 [Cyphomyrmex costatus]|uniref:Mos1 transposase HTH domain-containing protein n=1 Tax=Cyphomyrmex costatus TaxID=456900 RepID=A0A195C975_9HYME|nr:hypothetical protein ALC62_12710 [Cyphomyrmex costatus]
MSNFVLTKRNLQEALLFCFHLKKSVAKSQRILSEAYSDYTSSVMGRTRRGCRAGWQAQKRRLWSRFAGSGEFDGSVFPLEPDPPGPSRPTVAQ